ncbi:hypothetical protein [Neisseria chenwenguii]|nr:hypothetical protein [Neisseria chenwenguii]
MDLLAGMAETGRWPSEKDAVEKEEILPLIGRMRGSVFALNGIFQTA